MQHLEAPLKDARVRNGIKSMWVRLAHGDHALCRYRRPLTAQVVKFAREATGNTFIPVYYPAHLYSSCRASCTGATALRVLQVSESNAHLPKSKLLTCLLVMGAGVGVRLDVWRLMRRLLQQALSSRTLLDPVPLMIIASSVTGFMAGRFCATPEGRLLAQQEEAALDRLRKEAMQSPKVQFTL